MWNARSKNDLIIEVWEKLDCENVGAAEIQAIELVIVDQYGPAALDSPMVIARLLADEGADLRHSEIMDLYVERASDRPYDAALRNVLKIDDLKSAAGSIRNLESLRQKYKSGNDKEGLRLIRATALRGKQNAMEIADRKNADSVRRVVNVEIAQWLTVWLQMPEGFDSWVELRQASPDFTCKFGDARQVSES
ncbi:MAG: hypothetical protein ABIP78_11865 [Pyrinomonadaceae bacterium]